MYHTDSLCVGNVHSVSVEIELMYPALTYEKYGSSQYLSQRLLFLSAPPVFERCKMKVPQKRLPGVECEFGEAGVKFVPCYPVYRNQPIFTEKRSSLHVWYSFFYVKAWGHSLGHTGCLYVMASAVRCVTKICIPLWWDLGDIVYSELWTKSTANAFFEPLNKNYFLQD